jgi:tetrahydromethanopterin S-methyltransferase subunit E
MKSLPWSLLKSLTPDMIAGLSVAFIVVVFVGSLGVVIAGICFTTAFLFNHWDTVIFFLVLLIIIRVYRGRYRQTLLHQD